MMGTGWKNQMGDKPIRRVDNLLESLEAYKERNTILFCLPAPSRSGWKIQEKEKQIIRPMIVPLSWQSGFKQSPEDIEHLQTLSKGYHDIRL